MTARDTLLPAIDRIRSLGGIFGLRQWTATIRLRTWDGPRAGLGGFTDVNTPLVNVLPTSTAFAGTVAVTDASTAVAGTSTLFTTQLQPGAIVQFGNQMGINYVVASVQSPTALTLLFPFSGTTTASTSMQSNATSVIVRQLSRREVIASAGLYSDRDIKVGRMTPPYPAGVFGVAGGFDDTTMNPLPTNNAATQISWIVTGPGYPVAGAFCDKIGEEFTALHANVILRARGLVVP